MYWATIAVELQSQQKEVTGRYTETDVSGTHITDESSRGAFIKSGKEDMQRTKHFQLRAHIHMGNPRQYYPLLATVSLFHLQKQNENGDMHTSCSLSIG